MFFGLISWSTSRHSGKKVSAFPLSTGSNILTNYRMESLSYISTWEDNTYQLCPNCFNCSHSLNFLLPTTIAHKVDAMISRFFWTNHSGKGGKGIAWRRQEILHKPKSAVVSDYVVLRFIIAHYWLTRSGVFIEILTSSSARYLLPSPIPLRQHFAPFVLYEVKALGVRGVYIKLKRFFLLIMLGRLGATHPSVLVITAGLMQRYRYSAIRSHSVLRLLSLSVL